LGLVKWGRKKKGGKKCGAPGFKTEIYIYINNPGRCDLDVIFGSMRGE